VIIVGGNQPALQPDSQLQRHDDGHLHHHRRQRRQRLGHGDRDRDYRFNDPPVAQSQNLPVTEDTPLGIFLTGSDVDGDPLTFAS